MRARVEIGRIWGVDAPPARVTPKMSRAGRRGRMRKTTALPLRCSLAAKAGNVAENATHFGIEPSQRRCPPSHKRPRPAKTRYFIARRTSRLTALAKPSIGAVRIGARWRSGDVEDCKSSHPGSIPGRASSVDILSSLSKRLGTIADQPIVDGPWTAPRARPFPPRNRPSRIAGHLRSIDCPRSAGSFGLAGMVRPV